MNRPALRALPPPPDYPEHCGRPVTWKPWELIRVLCLPPRTCEGCGSTEDAYSAGGTVRPHPGETVTVTRQRPSTRVPGRTLGQDVEIPMWPYLALIAFACPACHHTEMFDTEDAAFRRIDPTHPALF
ncbi:hypothetical protein ACFVWN_20425 [Nocardiopsis flavescens]|uniref:hypothetical protein n=1 Tax=Nocardiopsis flavescens TaxID=758803 RepID=UPI0036531A96